MVIFSTGSERSGNDTGNGFSVFRIKAACLKVELLECLLNYRYTHLTGEDISSDRSFNVITNLVTSAATNMYSPVLYNYTCLLFKCCG